MTLAEVISKYAKMGPMAYSQLRKILEIITKRRIYTYVDYPDGEVYTNEIMNDLGFEFSEKTKKTAIHTANWPDSYSVDLGGGVSIEVKEESVDVCRYKMKS
jgi:hypothetical protein